MIEARWLFLFACACFSAGYLVPHDVAGGVQGRDSSDVDGVEDGIPITLE